MATPLIDTLAQIPDFRVPKGRRHPLWFVLLLTLMGTMSGYYGYRAIGAFVKRHRQALVLAFDIPKDRVPSYSTIRRVMSGVDIEQFTEVFNAWATHSFGEPSGEWLAIDGKGIAGTVSGARRAEQNFLSTVSVFCARRGVVVGSAKLENKKESELQTVRTLLEVLDLQGAGLSLDALHCQKNSEGDYR
jgi:DDE_Tnp_1-associated